MGNILEPSTAEGGAFDPQQNKKDSKVPTGEVIEIIAQNEGMKVAFKRLKDILTPYLKDDSVDVSL